MMMITKSWSPILLSSTLLLLVLSPVILVLALTDPSSSSANKGSAEAQPASIESKSVSDQEPKFQELAAQYRATISSFEQISNRVFGAVWYADALYLFLNTFNVTVQENLMDEFKSKLDALRLQKNQIVGSPVGHGRVSGLLLDAQKALKDFEQASGSDSQKSTKATLEASIAALKSVLEPLAPIAIGNRLKDDETHDYFIMFIEKWENYHRNYLKRQEPIVYEEGHLTVAQTMVETWLKVLNCAPDAEQAVERAGKVMYDSIHDDKGRLSWSPKGYKPKRKSFWKPLIIPGIIASTITFGFLYFLGSTLKNPGDGSELTTGSGDEDEDSGLVISMVTSFTTGGNQDDTDDGLLRMIALVLGVALVLLIAVGLAFWYYFSRKRIARTNV